MSYDLTQFPISPATDPNALIGQLGYFWRRVFKDRPVINGLAQGMTSGAEQNYADILDIINSYSAVEMPIFNRVNWYSMTITTEDLETTFNYDEGILFDVDIAGQSCLYDNPAPAPANVYSVRAPDELKELSIVADHIITPTKLWVAGQNIELRNHRIYFYNNPLTGTDGSITLWFYDAKTDANNLYNNVGFLFGLNVEHSKQGKDILKSCVDVLANGASIDNIRNVCKACLNLADADSATVDARINVVDNCVKNHWWQTDIVVTNDGVSTSLPLRLPPTMFMVGYEQMLQFNNSSEPVSLINAAADEPHHGYVVFPVEGTAHDVQLFRDTINSDPDFQANLEVYLSSSLYENPMQMNPVDFVFKSVLGSGTTMVHVKFNTAAELALFEQVFKALRNNLPKHIWLMFLCEFTAASEVLTFNPTSVVEEADLARYPLQDSGVIGEVAYMNTGGAGLMIRDMVIRRAIPEGATTQDFNNLSFTKPAV